MATIELNAEMARNLGIIAQDEGMMERAAKYLKRLANELTHKKEDPTLMTKEEYFKMIDRSLEQARQGKVTRISSKEELKAFLDSL
jgi:hypothetical protein